MYLTASLANPYPFILRVKLASYPKHRLAGHLCAAKYRVKAVAGA